MKKIAIGLTRKAINAMALGVMNVAPQTLPCVTFEGGFLEFSEVGPNRIDFDICSSDYCHY